MLVQIKGRPLGWLSPPSTIHEKQGCWAWLTYLPLMYWHIWLHHAAEHESIDCAKPKYLSGTDVIYLCFSCVYEVLAHLTASVPWRWPWRHGETWSPSRRRCWPRCLRRGMRTWCIRCVSLSGFSSVCVCVGEGGGVCMCLCSCMCLCWCACVCGVTVYVCVCACTCDHLVGTRALRRWFSFSPVE